MHVLHVAAEAQPWVHTGGLAETVASLARALAARGHRIAVVLPLYRGIALEQREVFAAGIEVALGVRSFSCTLLRERGRRAHGVDFYFVDCPALFDRPGIYGAGEQDFPDNPERFAVFSHAALELAARLRPDVVHAHDWHTALVPVLLPPPAAGGPGTVFTIHNLGYQGMYPAEVLARLGLDWKLFRVEALEFWGRINLLKGALLSADAITTVSPAYSQEIQTAEHGMGLEGVLRECAPRLRGILNGIDTLEWDPARDRRLAAAFDADHLEGRVACRQALVKLAGLAHPERPLAVMVSRLSWQKGLDLLDACLPDLVARQLNLLVLGTGEAALEAMVGNWQERYPEWIRAWIRYDEDLAHRLMAGADLLLMPSRYEPCGLSQMHAMRYGAVPVVRAAGGLKDSVEDWDSAHPTGTGFCFQAFRPEPLLAALDRALTTLGRSEEWRQLQRNGMTRDWSWQRAAAEFEPVYQGVLQRRAGNGGGPGTR